ncbi:hypothetical protein H5395_17305 [Paracoccus sp. MC1854]|uniref:hypothetical protein n=1 Tax=Paracoccus sp. MC1854 TaxID=2760306 RepID=UPI001602FF2E|nr:hypothetical protein [Paracoccus sp. MC1854]MBB1493216.1 hypothetical protein [Paracoccus sp. MC1854]
MLRPPPEVYVGLLTLLLTSGCRDENPQRQFEDVSGDIGRYLAIDSEDPGRTADRLSLLGEITNELDIIRTEYPNTKQGRQIADDQPIIGIRPSDLFRELTMLQLCERDVMSCAALLSIETARDAPDALPDAIRALAAVGQMAEVEKEISLLDAEDRRSAIDAALDGLTVTHDWQGAERLIALLEDNHAEQFDIIRTIIQKQAASDPRLALETVSTWVKAMPENDTSGYVRLESGIELYAQLGSAKDAVETVAMLPEDRQFGTLLQLYVSFRAHRHDEAAKQIDKLVAAKIAKMEGVTARSVAWSRVAAAKSKVAASGAVADTSEGVASLMDVDIDFGNVFGARERTLPSNDGELGSLVAEELLEADTEAYTEALASGRLEQAMEAAKKARDIALSGPAGPVRDRELDQVAGMLAAVGDGHAAIVAARAIADATERAKTQARIAISLAVRASE